ncbi:MAG: acetate uptake transporter [Intrasporangium sp.]|uniref:acetate uptake transporter n=1 Tax=Intrasporangium sp. TaxID=1925024 RepID=UPI002649BA58|nr:acetate uptake transporter [Intrasporangium sp.]MDN5794579.1 acetate uptake transporter [Intrasporangium sp.]
MPHGTPQPEASALPKTTPGSHIADPAPLGLGAFALTTFVLSFVNTGLFHVEPVVFGLALAYGGLAQLCAGMWEFAKGNTFGATAFSSYGAFWISFWWLTGHSGLDKVTDANALGDSIGLYLIAWAIFTGYMTIAATRTTGAVLAVFVLLTITYVLLAIGAFSASEVITKIGGWVGVATALAAWYASFAGVVKFTFGRDVVPVGPRE